MKWLELKIPPLIVMLVVAILMWTGSLSFSAYAMNGNVRIIVAIMLGLAGIWIAGIGVRTFGQAKTTVNPVMIDGTSSLVTNGVFSYTRNPMYVGMALVLVAWTVFLSSPWLLIGPMVFVIYIDRFQIRPEEAFLQAKFGQAYTDYRQRVRRWI